MNRTIKDATVKRYHYDTHAQFEAHVTDFIAAYNYARRLKTLQGLSRSNTSAKSGQTNLTDSMSTPPTTCWD